MVKITYIMTPSPAATIALLEAITKNVDIADSIPEVRAHLFDIHDSALFCVYFVVTFRMQCNFAMIVLISNATLASSVFFSVSY